MIGEMGTAVVDVDPDGVVRVRDAQWRARTNRATPIKAGDAIRVVEVDGPMLEVEPEAGGARDYREQRERRKGPNPPRRLVMKRLPTGPDLHEFARVFTEFAKVHR